mgnify:CR=1 FL=1
MNKLIEFWEIITAAVLIVATFSALSTRVTAVEVRQNEDRENQQEIRRDVIDIKADVSYIRGRLEPK